jgi:hypothetical protein
VQRDVNIDFGIFGDWYKYDERRRPHAIDPIDHLQSVLQFMQSPHVLKAMDAEILVKNHAFVNFRGHFSPTTGAGYLCVTSHPQFGEDFERPLHSGCFGDALCHQSRIQPGPVWADIWGKPQLAAMANLDCSVVTRSTSQKTALSQMLTLVVDGAHLAFITKVRVILATSGGEAIATEYAPDFTTTDKQLRVTVELKTHSSDTLNSAILIVKVQSHFAVQTWETHRVQLPEQVVEAALLTARESRVAGLDLGQLLNEAIVCSTFGIAIPDRTSLLHTLSTVRGFTMDSAVLGLVTVRCARVLAGVYTRGCHCVSRLCSTSSSCRRVTNGIPLGCPLFLTSLHCKLRPITEGELELGKNFAEDSRWTPQAWSHYKDTVDKVTDRKTGNIVAGVEGLLTFSVTTQQVQKLVQIDVGNGENVETVVQGFQQAQEDGGDVAARQRAADMFGNDVQRNAQFQRDLADSAAESTTAGSIPADGAYRVPALKFDEAVKRHTLPSFDAASDWAVCSLDKDSQVVSDRYDPATAVDGDGLDVPKGVLSARDVQTLEKESAGRRDSFMFWDTDSTPFGHHFNAGKVCHANVLSGIIDIDFTMSTDIAVRGRRYARPECNILTGLQLDTVVCEGRVKFMGLHKPHDGTGPEFCRSLPFVWDSAVTEEPRSASMTSRASGASSSGKSSAHQKQKHRNSEIVVAVRSLMNKAYQEGSGPRFPT